ncbi:exodeoxyribonuclease III [Lapidilactobacillus concavus DSM 17758]|jgi:exodeoxyribonuclease-3|uniref:Exodeoxyribonuclease III n=2 Tax=Lapidilactobacillus TaxID=2767884 RepID=A0A0R1W6Y9_9LACO|nr:exodeoxyribonuclease III [Lapidilactobacillus concavus DSM 17758]
MLSDIEMIGVLIMKLISWNVNGLRAVLKKDFLTTFKALDADFFCLQETKMQADQVVLDLPGYHQYFNYAERKGYSGTAIFTKATPLNVSYGLGIEVHDHEGRVITLEYPDFYLLTCYTPNSQSELKRLPYRLEWDEAFRHYVHELSQKKSVVFCGDLNVAHEEIDLKNPKTNHHNAGFSDAERASFTTLLSQGFTDSFRYLHPDQTDAYSWWSYRFHAREHNAGWRIDYFVVSDDLQSKIQDATILADIYGSDHCPVELDLSI